jgi:hypothetical protein
MIHLKRRSADHRLGRAIRQTGDYFAKRVDVLLVEDCFGSGVVGSWFKVGHEAERD